MSNFTGVLLMTSDGESFLDRDLLLKAGIPDPGQAAFAATGFLHAKGLGSGQAIVVTGTKGNPVGGVSTIIMTDSFAAVSADEALKPILEKMAAKPKKKPSRKEKGQAVAKKEPKIKRAANAKKVSRKDETGKR